MKKKDINEGLRYYKLAFDRHKTEAQYDLFCSM